MPPDDPTFVNPREQPMESQPKVVAIGASAGGLEALESFFESMTSGSGLAFVVIQHLSPDYKSLMVELLSRHTNMTVARAEDGMPVAPDHIYLIPPKKNLTIFHGKLHLTDQKRDSTVNLPIDIFMKSLADDQGERSIGIILSGTGSDGMRGVRAVKEAGGMVMVQDPASSKFDGMPKSALATGLVDFILPPGDMPGQLLQYVQHPYVQSAERESALVSSEDNLSKVLSLIQHEVGVDFSYYKPSTIVRRIERRMSINQVWELSDYIEMLESSPRELTTLYKELLIGVTSFFRDPEAFQSLKESALPELFENLGEDGIFRAWCAGCSTGEEAYSLAILLREYADANNLRVDIKVFATDLDKDALDFAGLGVYPESIVADLTPERLARFFTRKGESYHVNRQIREMVIFARHNVLRDPPFTKIDLLTCRNLLIYLQSPIQRKVFSLFDFAVKPGGFLLLGMSETLGDTISQFEVVDRRLKLYRCRGGARKPLTELLGSDIGRRRLPKRVGPVPAERLSTEDERLLEPLYQELISDYVPPTILVDEHHEILRIFSDVGDLVRFPVGKPSANLTKAVHPGLSSALVTALHKAVKTGQEVSYKNVQYREKETDQRVDLLVKPFEHRLSSERLYFVFFERRREHRPSTDESTQVMDAQDTSTERISDLERELQYTKENLQATIEELETSNEELQATNQELVSANEELQSTNEELQSVNEELYTVNAEYQGKIQELITLNNDMDNLLHATSVGTLFLDSNLQVRKFTSRATRHINVLDHDIGRPLEHLSYRFEYPGFIPDIHRVQQSQETIEKEVFGSEGEHTLVILAPYRQEQASAGEGVVVTFVDITPLKRVEEALTQERDLLNRIMHSSESAIIATNTNGRITLTNRRAEELFGMTREALLDRPFEDLAAAVTGEDGAPFPVRELPVYRVLDTGEPCSGVKFIAERADGTRKDISGNAGPLMDEDGNPTGAVCTLVDITEQETRRRELEEERERHRFTLRAANLGTWDWNIRENRLTWSERTTALFGFASGEFGGAYEDFLECVHPEDRQRVGEAVQACLESGEEYEIEHRIIRSDGSQRRVWEAADVLRDAQGAAVHMIGVVREIQELARQE